MHVGILVTPVFGHKKEFIFLNMLKVFGDLFQRSHNSVSLSSVNPIFDLAKLIFEEKFLVDLAIK